MTRSADDKRARFLEAQQHSPGVPVLTDGVSMQETQTNTSSSGLFRFHDKHDESVPVTYIVADSLSRASKVAEEMGITPNEDVVVETLHVDDEHGQRFRVIVDKSTILQQLQGL